MLKIIIILLKRNQNIIIPDDESNINKEDDVFNNSGKRRREESNLNIDKNSRRKIDISDDNNKNNNNQITTTLFDYSNLVLPSHNSLSSLIKLYKRGSIYSESACLYDKDNHPVFQFKNPEDEFSNLVQIPFKEKKFTQTFFNTIQDLGNIYNEKDQLYTFFALEKPIDIKGVYYYGVIKNSGKVEYFEVIDEIDSSKVIKYNDNNTFIVLYNFQGNPCCIDHIFNNHFNILIY
jgi:hypothetical protein